MNLVVDTSFVIDHMLGDVGAADRWRRVFEDGDTPLVTEIVVCEVRTGLRERDEPYLTSFLGPVEFIQPGVGAALQAGRWRDAAHRRGRRLSLADALIAAAAEDSGAAVLTRNVRDFALTPVRIETY
jgi:predicted nucleic acid-binding protein